MYYYQLRGELKACTRARPFVLARHRYSRSGNASPGAAFLFPRWNKFIRVSIFPSTGQFDSPARDLHTMRPCVYPASEWNHACEHHLYNERFTERSLSLYRVSIHHAGIPPFNAKRFFHPFFFLVSFDARRFYYCFSEWKRREANPMPGHFALPFRTKLITPRLYRRRNTRALARY